MIVYSRKNILFQENGQTFLLKKDAIGAVPEWVSSSAYFAALKRDGKVVISEISESKKDAVLEEKVKKAESVEKEKTEAQVEKVQKGRKK